LIGYGIGNPVRTARAVVDAEMDRLVADYDDSYVVAEALRPGESLLKSLRDAARTEGLSAVPSRAFAA
jgi:L-arabinose isomerase